MDVTHDTPASDLESTGIVAIDDSGTPGTPAKSSSLHLNRKTWVAVIVPAPAIARLRIALKMFIDGVRGDYGVDELHFTDIYNGRGAFKPVPVEKRYELFALMAEMFECFKLPIFVQTCSPENLAEIRSHMTDWPENLPWFRLDNHEHIALLFLLCRIRMFVREQSEILPRPLPVVIDAGLMKPGSSLSMPGWADLFAHGRATFQNSHENPFLQLADFAAFTIARTQWIASAGVKKHRDLEFLKTVSADKLWVVNLPAGAITPDERSAVEYERILQADRALKCLPLDPRWRVRIVNAKKP